jgi:hypothetical protein
MYLVYLSLSFNTELCSIYSHETNKDYSYFWHIHYFLSIQLFTKFEANQLIMYSPSFTIPLGISGDVGVLPIILGVLLVR